jgi:hypothetical protein
LVYLAEPRLYGLERRAKDAEGLTLKEYGGEVAPFPAKELKLVR